MCIARYVNLQISAPFVRAFGDVGIIKTWCLGESDNDVFFFQIYSNFKKLKRKIAP